MKTPSIQNQLEPKEQIWRHYSVQCQNILQSYHIYKQSISVTVLNDSEHMTNIYKKVFNISNHQKKKIENALRRYLITVRKSII